MTPLSHLVVKLDFLKDASRTEVEDAKEGQPALEARRVWHYVDLRSGLYACETPGKRLGNTQRTRQRGGLTLCFGCELKWFEAYREFVNQDTSEVWG